MGKNKSIFISSLRELIIFEVKKQNLDEVNKDFRLCFSLSKNCMQNEVWGCEEILTSFILFLADNMEGGNQGTV